MMVATGPVIDVLTRIINRFQMIVLAVNIMNMIMSLLMGMLMTIMSMIMIVFMIMLTRMNLLKFKNLIA